jgi:hypothetical protein
MRDGVALIAIDIQALAATAPRVVVRGANTSQAPPKPQSSDELQTKQTQITPAAAQLTLEPRDGSDTSGSILGALAAETRSNTCYEGARR